MKTDILQAATILREGGLVAFPTETVYGLGGDAKNSQAVQRIFAAKERPFNHPLIVHIGQLDEIEKWAQEVSPAAKKLMQAFWPGPLTLILKKQTQVLDSITGGQDTIGLRMPDHPIALALLKAFGSGVAAPSANKFTHISPTTAAAVYAELGNEVDYILDGGSCEVGLESSIVDLSGGQPTLLRPGMLNANRIAAVLGYPITTINQSKIQAPGMHHLHYAPSTKAVLMKSNELVDYVKALSVQHLPAVCMVRGSVYNTELEKRIKIVAMPMDATAYAHDLYHTLRLLDNQHFKQIIIEAVPQGLSLIHI